MWRIALLALALVAAPCASASNVATPKMNAVATWSAGKTVTAWCESEASAWSAITSARGVNPSVAGFTVFAEPVVYLSPQVCTNLNYPLTDPRLGVGLDTLLHESAHQRGFRDEALTECAARVLIYSALREFYGVPFFSPTMRLQVNAALAYSLALPAVYQHGCERLP